MKRLVIGLIVTVLVAAALFGLLYLTGGEAWRTFLDEKLWPTVASVMSSIFGIYLLVSPVISRLSKSAGTMGGAAAEFAAASAALSAVREDNEALQARVQALEEALESAKQEAAAQRKRFGKLCRVFAIGWGADERMVKSGATRKMVEMVEEFEHEEGA